MAVVLFLCWVVAPAAVVTWLVRDRLTTVRGTLEIGYRVHHPILLLVFLSLLPPATARGEEKLKVARDHGADHTIDYGTEDIRDRVMEITGKKGADVIYDPVGGDVFDASLRCLAWEGRLLIIGFASGRIPEAPANYLLVKNAAAVGVFWGAYMRRNPQVIVDSFRVIMAWYAEGKIKPHISHRFPLDDAAEALKVMMERKSTGKVVIDLG